ncbi:DUF2786 domain-containing protein, partial [Escherichia coli]
MSKQWKLCKTGCVHINPHEAAQALSRAQALMRKHGITELDADISVIKTSSSKGA